MKYTSTLIKSEMFIFDKLEAIEGGGMNELFGYVSCPQGLNKIYCWDYCLGSMLTNSKELRVKKLISLFFVRICFFII